MINYKNLRRNYLENNQDSIDKQLAFLDRIEKEFSMKAKSLVLNTFTPPTREIFSFFSTNYGYLIPLFVEEYESGQDVYCLNVENPNQNSVSVFSGDGIIHEWLSYQDFINWLEYDSGYFETE